MKDRDVKALTPLKKGLPVPWGPSRWMVGGAATLLLQGTGPCGQNLSKRQLEAGLPGLCGVTSLSNRAQLIPGLSHPLQQHRSQGPLRCPSV